MGRPMVAPLLVCHQDSRLRPYVRPSALQYSMDYLSAKLEAVQTSALSSVATDWLDQVSSATSAEGRKALYTAAIRGEFTGGVYSRLDRESRRATGVFFSGEDWAKTLLAKIPKGKWDRYIDPSAGVGDLLTAVATRFHRRKNLALTLKVWSRRLVAVDLEPEFIRLLWIRIVSLALVRHGYYQKPRASIFEVPSSFKVGDFLDLTIQFKKGDCIITNPPYQRISGGGGKNGGGLRSAAAIHLERVLTQAPRGVGLVALVPDVLRCGTNYRKFREQLGEALPTVEIESHGQFSCGVDVDVAIISGITGKRSAAKGRVLPAPPTITETIADRFKVSVGSVVPHRDPEDGELRPYIAARSLKKWEALREVLHWARFSSKMVTCPFVVVRRTSSPSDRKRAVATIIDLKFPVLVENHLIVIEPKSGGMTECLELLRSLEDPRTDDWLNAQMRCRHLTVGVIRSMPFHAEGAGDEHKESECKE